MFLLRDRPEPPARPLEDSFVDLVIGELVSRTVTAPVTFRPGSWTYVTGSPTAVVKVFNGQPAGLYGVTKPQSRAWRLRLRH